MQKIEKLFFFFLATSVLGWLYEVILEVFVYRWGFSNRGVLTGPYCVVYGVGSLLLLFCLHRLLARRICVGRINIAPALVFLAIVLLTTLVELGASYLMEWLHGNWAWDYTRFWLHFEGRIAPNPSIRFGIGGMVILYLLYPLFARLIQKIPAQKLHLFAGCAALLFGLDCICAFLR